MVISVALQPTCFTKHASCFLYSLPCGLSSLFCSKDRLASSPICTCPVFGQDRVNFHQNTGRDTAGWADPTCPNRAGYSIPCAIMLGSGGGELGGGNSLAAQEYGRRSSPVQESGSLGCAVCVVFSPCLYCCCSFSLCLLFC